MFGALSINGSGMHVHHTWMDAISDNIANVNTVRSTSDEPFRSRYVIAESVENGNGGVGGGVTVGGIELSKNTTRLVFSPDHPLADEKGLVQLADVDLAEQLTTMVMAQRGYQANIAQFDRVRASYQAAIQMGRG